MPTLSATDQGVKLVVKTTDQPKLQNLIKQEPDKPPTTATNLHKDWNVLVKEGARIETTEIWDDFELLINKNLIDALKRTLETSLKQFNLNSISGLEPLANALKAITASLRSLITKRTFTWLQEYDWEFSSPEDALEVLVLPSIDGLVSIRSDRIEWSVLVQTRLNRGKFSELMLQSEKGKPASLRKIADSKAFKATAKQGSNDIKQVVTAVISFGGYQKELKEVTGLLDTALKRAETLLEEFLEYVKNLFTSEPDQTKREEKKQKREKELLEEAKKPIESAFEQLVKLLDRLAPHIGTLTIQRSDFSISAVTTSERKDDGQILDNFLEEERQAELHELFVEEMKLKNRKLAWEVEELMISPQFLPLGENELDVGSSIIGISRDMMETISSELRTVADTIADAVDAPFLITETNAKNGEF